MEMFFSDFAANLGGPSNPLYQLHERLKAEGGKVTDLVRGNVNEHGIVYPPDILTEILKDAARAAQVYRPDSLGQRPARDAVAQHDAGNEHLLLVLLQAADRKWRRDPLSTAVLPII
jgi:hypothetical protein